MQVGTKTVSGIARVANDLAGFYSLSLFYRNRVQVCVQRMYCAAIPICMSDLHHIAIAICITLGTFAIPVVHNLNGAIFCSQHRCSNQRPHINCLVHTAIVIKPALRQDMISQRPI